MGSQSAKRVMKVLEVPTIFHWELQCKSAREARREIMLDWHWIIQNIIPRPPVRCVIVFKNTAFQRVSWSALPTIPSLYRRRCVRGRHPEGDGWSDVRRCGARAVQHGPMRVCVRICVCVCVCVRARTHTIHRRTRARAHILPHTGCT